VGLAHKWKGGQETDIDAIVVYVSRKVPSRYLAAEHVIPAEIDGVPTDVVELAADYLGQTPISRMHPDDVKKMLGAIPDTSPKVTAPVPQNQAPAANESDFSGYAGPVANQNQCGCCVAEGGNGDFETELRIAGNDPNMPVLLSIDLPFFCSGGSCANGSTVEQYLAYLKSSGTVLDEYCPWAGSPAVMGDEMTCQQGCVTGWQDHIIKLPDWKAVTDPFETLTLLDSGPLVITMLVRQSFLSYTGPGVYKHLPSGDPILGGHCMFITSKNISAGWRAIKNSWDVTWGQKTAINGVARPGFCLIDPGELDATMYKLVVAAPAPPPPVVTVDKTFTVQLQDLTLKPPAPVVGVPVNVYVTDPSQVSITLSGITTPLGTFVITKGLAPGPGYVAQASFLGVPGKYKACLSPTVRFDVVDPTPNPPTPPAPTEHDTGLTLTVQ
jgi:Papain family cysteine protease